MTNWVTIYDCANMTRAFGALPVMAHAKEEVEEMVGLASALVLNIGTLTPEFIDAMIVAGKAANKKCIPVVLDAVGAGATKLRTKSTLRMLGEVKVDILKGNYGEVGVIAGVEAEVKGVESMGLTGDPAEIARMLGERLGNTVVMTGKTDIVSDGKTTYFVENGHEMMGSIVGTGCMAASVIGAFVAVEEDNALAAASALGVYGIAGEIAAEKSMGPGTFKEQFYDAVSGLDGRVIKDRLKINTMPKT
ncbi:MAG: hydroxyethylthiazole kinase [Candidatus Altiarchaeota archaeon]|nr:hydroxyethylthiazole kinase [Candidatus Altiarchaeota archaeon]